MRRTPSRAAPATLAVCAVLVLAVCGTDDTDVGARPDGTTTTVEAARECSAAGAPVTVVPQAGLPSEVQATRARLIEAAIACDYDALGQLAAGGSGDFSFTFGGDQDPVAFWQRAEAAGEEPLRALVVMLEAEHGSRPVAGTTQYVWPHAYTYSAWDEVPDADIDDLRDFYDAEAVARFEQAGAYLGYRVGIADDGTWAFFVAGD